ncbi:MAG: miaA, partial [Bacteroidetes bacterium]|nr:miaA [Bacteroidota bacterium]
MKRSLPKVLAIVGPTASGKTPLAIELAGMLDGEIVSADSRQVYKYLDIGTAKPSPSELNKIPHHVINVFEPGQDYNAGQFGKDAVERIGEILRRNKLPILVGGSGLYVKAAIDGLFEGPGKDPEVRERLEEQLKEGGAEELMRKLRAVDPESAEKSDIHKPRRIIRALEVYYITGKPISQLHSEQERVHSFSTHQFALNWDREALYAMINMRVDRMLKDGLVDEVKSLSQRGYGVHLNALNTVGYKEVFAYLDGKIDSDSM